MMNKILFYLFLFFFPCLAFSRSTMFQNRETIDWTTLQYTEYPYCHITWLKDKQGNRFLLKQVKDTDPTQQLTLITDALACLIGHAFSIPVNQVELIGADEPFPGKNLENYPATLHTCAPGVLVEDNPPWKRFTIQQRHRIPGSWLENKLGPMPERRKGLTRDVIDNLFLSSDLQKIAALDTFLGDNDRGNVNIFYDQTTSQFCAIDMGEAFRHPLVEIACRQLTQCPLEKKEIAQLKVYRETLQLLYQHITPEWIAEQLDGMARRGGFFDQKHLHTPSVIKHLERHKTVFQENYECVPRLIQLLGES